MQDIDKHRHSVNHSSHAFLHDGFVEFPGFHEGDAVEVRVRQGFTPAGRYSESWNGVDSGGRQAMPGVYFVRLESGTYRSTRKLVRIR